MSPGFHELEAVRSQAQTPEVNLALYLLLHYQVKPEPRFAGLR